MSTAAESTGSNGTLLCTLVDRRSSVPLSDARVTCVIGGGIIQVDVDSRGEFRADFPQGVFDLVISARGELSLTLRGIGILAGHTQRMLRAFVPGEDEASDGVPASAIGGYLTDRLGKPVPDVAVTATLVPPPGTPLYGGPQKQTYASQTDKFGAFIIHAIKPGTYDVVVRNRQSTLSNERVTVPDRRVFQRHDLKLMVTI
jgi:hypothetical protein